MSRFTVLHCCSTRVRALHKKDIRALLKNEYKSLIFFFLLQCKMYLCVCVFIYIFFVEMQIVIEIKVCLLVLLQTHTTLPNRYISSICIEYV